MPESDVCEACAHRTPHAARAVFGKPETAGKGPFCNTLGCECVGKARLDPNEGFVRGHDQFGEVTVLPGGLAEIDGTIETLMAAASVDGKDVAIRLVFKEDEDGKQLEPAIYSMPLSEAMAAVVMMIRAVNDARRMSNERSKLQ